MKTIIRTRDLQSKYKIHEIVMNKLNKIYRRKTLHTSEDHKRRLE